ncbi:MAG TPA: response regulator [Pirellulaceae bacterium]|nr:response regulator [Pirellulaceae bacterium]
MQSNLRNVLHVDDDPQMLRIVGERLRSRGYNVISLGDPTQTIGTLLDHNFRVAILDIDMPGISGLDLLSQIKEYDGGVQVIMLTSLVSMNSILESMRRGAEACLFKPVLNFDEIYSTLDASFQKLDRWWKTLEELTRRRQAELPPVPAQA